MIKAVFQIFLFILPWPLRRRLLSLFLGYKLHPKSRVGLSIFFADAVELGPETIIGHFNYVGRLDKLLMHEDSLIGNFNWITGLSQKMNSPYFRSKTTRRSELIMGKSSSIIHWHNIDCTDRIEMAPYAALAGIRTQLITHGVEMITCRQTCSPITIGEYTVIGGGTIILKGVRVPRCCIVTPGAMITHIGPEPYALISGNPAKEVRKIPETAKVFFRTRRHID